jgi:hypothetical protein
MVLNARSGPSWIGKNPSGQYPALSKTLRRKATAPSVVSCMALHPAMVNPIADTVRIESKHYEIILTQ